VRETRTGCVHCVAICKDCGWEYQNHKNGLALAAQHHDRTGHTVHVEIGNVVIYGNPATGISSPAVRLEKIHIGKNPNLSEDA